PGPEQPDLPGRVRRAFARCLARPATTPWGFFSPKNRQQAMTNLFESTATEQTAPPVEPPAHLPPLLMMGDGWAPKAPTDPRDAGVSPAVLRDLALKAAYTVPQFTTEWAARQLCLAQVLVGELLEQLRTEQLLEILGSSGPFGFRYTI